MRRIVILLLATLLSFAARAGENAGVLIVGNSLTYVNHLPALFNGLVAAQPGGLRWQADLVGMAGGSLAEHWSNGAVARELASGRWQAVVLQERGGVLACQASPQGRDAGDCAASAAAHRRFIELAQRHNVRVIVLGTWGPDAIWQAKLSRGAKRVAGKAELLDAGPLLRDYGKAHPETAMTTDAIGHPTLDASLLLAGALYRQLTASTPQAIAFETRAPMLPPLARLEAGRLLSQQPQVAGDGSVTRIEAARLAPLFAALATLPVPATGGK